ncbi:hypothetical protein GGS23DRAFT_557827 [Durotheca rogersii]|uniref:uncharacterized protein n=1 Tax=Durotheca rogersii TaxID=419775 RepID=UPI00221EEDD0|nr:uncharacterized protein GGS23DRAFT_557827 [Durotheca rogersii]KAI5865130.1 hypothetical protein GGS23DRAFT_557827 [Durotheca rogersii]
MAGPSNAKKKSKGRKRKGKKNGPGNGKEEAVKPSESEKGGPSSPEENGLAKPEEIRPRGPEKNEPSNPEKAGPRSKEKNEPVTPEETQPETRGKRKPDNPEKTGPESEEKNEPAHLEETQREIREKHKPGNPQNNHASSPQRAKKKYEINRRHSRKCQRRWINRPNPPFNTAPLLKEIDRLLSQIKMDVETNLAVASAFLERISRETIHKFDKMDLKIGLVRLFRELADREVVEHESRARQELARGEHQEKNEGCQSKNKGAAEYLSERFHQFGRAWFDDSETQWNGPDQEFAYDYNPESELEPLRPILPPEHVEIVKACLDKVSNACLGRPTDVRKHCRCFGGPIYVPPATYRLDFLYEQLSAEAYARYVWQGIMSDRIIHEGGAAKRGAAAKGQKAAPQSRIPPPSRRRMSKRRRVVNRIILAMS